MYYRDKNPFITHSTCKSLSEYCNFFPFDGPCVNAPLEFIAPDNVTRFIGIYGGGDESEDLVLSSMRYLIESPLDCPMRKAFVNGEVTWEDYWHHKGWVIELAKPNILVDFAHVRYVHPTQMSEEANKNLKSLEDRSPMSLKHDGLCILAERESRSRKRHKPMHKKLEDFERAFGQFIQRKSA